jgi:hypothetical protein
MRKSISKLALAAAFGLALAFTFSCSSDDGGGGNDDVSYYKPDNENTRCRGGVVESKCVNGEWYNSEKYVCTSDYDEFSNIYYYLITREQYYEQNGYLRCGSSYYPPNYPDSYRCQGKTLEFKCNDEWYNSEKYVCTSDYDEFSNRYYYLITYEQYYEKLEQQGYVRCR